MEEDSSITMFDEEGNESAYNILSTKKDGNSMFMLAEEEISKAAEDEHLVEVLIFKCVDEEEPEEMVFELVDEDHESFELALSLFKEDFDNLGIDY